ncbi:hypothetical protein [Beijerinckia mobilis]|uniref:hypothetical protein n=1 Tax=Beijerinckia mobilis TaxID=231434 RepID=UPI001FD8A762|nr:hypothetical protein [Beijerinckia mobilis]
MIIVQAALLSASRFFLFLLFLPVPAKSSTIEGPSSHSREVGFLLLGMKLFAEN